MAEHGQGKDAAAASGCPTLEQLSTLVFGGGVTTNVASHVATCVRCAAIVAQTRPSEAVLAGQLLVADTMVGRYRIVRRIGHGGMGVVYLAIDTELEREVALKLVRSGGAASLDELTEQLRRESRLQARTKHRCVITVYDIGRDGERVYVAMELARGGTLRAWLGRAPRGWRVILDVFRRAGQGLAAAHAAGLVHRDFKPDNVLVEEDGDRVTRVMVSDFGLARAIEAAARPSIGEFGDVLATAPGMLAGTPAYMAPEQLQGAAVDMRADVFAFGVGLWEALYGARPYAGNSVVSMIAAMVEPLPAPTRGDGVPHWLERVLRRALAIDPAKRYASMDEVLHALDWRRHRRRRWSAAVAVAVLAAAGTTLVVARAHAPVSPCDRDPENTLALRAASARLRLADVGDRARRRDLWADTLDRFARTSDRLRVDVCRATPRPANWADRVRCIDERTAATSALADALARSPVTRTRLVVESPPPEPPLECRSNVAGTIATALTAFQRAAVAQVELDVDAAMSVGDHDRDDSVRLLAQILDRARATGIRSVADEVLAARAWMLRDTPTAKDELRAVAVAAQRDGAPALAARSWLDMARRDSTTDRKAMRDALVQADSALELAGNPPSIRALWHALSAYAYAAESKGAEAANDIAAADALVASGDATADLDLAEVLGDAELSSGNATAAVARYARTFDQLATTAPIDREVVRFRVRYAAGLILNKHFDKALDILAPALAALDPARRVTGSDAVAIQMMAYTYNQLARYTDTEQLVARWQPAIDRDLRAQDAQTVGLIHQQAIAALALGSFTTAERASARVLERYVESFGADVYDTAVVRVLHGHVLLELGRVAAARDDLERGAKDLSATRGDADPDSIESKVWLAAVQLRTGNAGQALATIEAAIEPYRQLAPDPGSMAAAELVEAEVLVANHRDLARVRSLLEHALSLWKSEPGAWRAEAARAKVLLAKLRR